MRFVAFIISFFMFLTGGFIYLLYRSLTLRMFSWLKTLGLYQMVLSWRESLGLCHLPNWVIYSLPDGLWMGAYLLLMYMLWYKITTWDALAFPLVLPLFMNITEVLQGFDLFPGTFDIIDMLCYDIPVIVYILNYIYEKKYSINCFCHNNRGIPVNGSRVWR